MTDEDKFDADKLRTHGETDNPDMGVVFLVIAGLIGILLLAMSA